MTYHVNVNVNLGRKFSWNQNWKNDKCWCQCKKHHICENVYIWNPATCSCKNDKYLASIIDNSVITCEKITDLDSKLYDKETKPVTTNFNEKHITCKTQNVYILLAFLLITMALSICVSICSYPIKYGAKQKHWLPFHDTNNK